MSTATECSSPIWPARSIRPGSTAARSRRCWRLKAISWASHTGNFPRGKMIRRYDKPIHRIAIIGPGVIGASWAAQYLARGFDVVATAPASNAEANLRKYVQDAWNQLK